MTSFAGDAAAATQSVITQVTAQTGGRFAHEHINTAGAADIEITLNLRGQKFHLPREELMTLPESVLLCLFPNGVFVDGQGNMVSTITGTDVITVDVSIFCIFIFHLQFTKEVQILTFSSSLLHVCNTY